MGDIFLFIKFVFIKLVILVKVDRTICIWPIDRTIDPSSIKWSMWSIEIHKLDCHINSECARSEKNGRDSLNTGRVPPTPHFTIESIHHSSPADQSFEQMDRSLCRSARSMRFQLTPDWYCNIKQKKQPINLLVLSICHEVFLWCELVWLSGYSNL